MGFAGGRAGFKGCDAHIYEFTLDMAAVGEENAAYEGEATALH